MLFDQWAALWERAGSARNRARYPYDRLVARYQEPHRHYHTLAHIQHCLQEFAAVREHASNPDAVEMAIWFHDAVYDPKAKDNEERSAQLAAVVLDVGGFPDDFIAKVGGLVLSTSHAAASDDPDAGLLADVDLAILGQPEAAFDEYERQIRREYAWVPKETFAVRRASVLAAFLARQRLYVTSPMFGAYEAAARSNLGRSLDRLRAGIVLT